MTAWAGFIFWASLLGVVYTYFGYPLLLFVCYGLSQMSRDLRYLMNRRERRRDDRPAPELPALSMLIAAYNEEEHLAEKISNIAALDYPADKLQVVIVSDGSSDGTNSMLRQISDPRIEVVIQPERGGKAVALNIALEHARHDILVLSDCSTMFSPTR